MASVRYVNTASTPGGNGTTNATAGANRAYASMQEVADAMSNPIGDQFSIYCSGTGADTLVVNQAHLDFQTSAANYLEIIGDNTTGKWNPAAYRLQVTNSDGIYNNICAHVRLKNLQIQITVSSSVGDDFVCYRLATANNDTTGNVDHRVINCIARVVVSGGATDNVIGFFDSDPTTAAGGTAAGGTCRRINCIAYGGAAAGFGSDASAWAIANLGNYNCTSYGNEFNYIDPQICVNCIGASPAVGNSFESVGSGGHFNNASTDTSANGTNSRDSQTFSFADAANGDFHLLVTDTGAKGWGLADPLSGLYDYDIDGGTRTGAWDIGADQYGVAGGGGTALQESEYFISRPQTNPLTVSKW